MAKFVLAELLRFIAANEPLPRALQRYPGYDRDTLGKLINAAADRIEELEKAKDEKGGPGSKRRGSSRRSSATGSGASGPRRRSASGSRPRPRRRRSARSGRASSRTA